MVDFPDRETALTLINEALTISATLNVSPEVDFQSAFLQAQAALSVMACSASQVPLLLSAARRHVQSAERKIVTLILGDHPLDHEQMSVLVQLRILSARLISLLTTSLEKVKRSRQQA